MIFHKPRFSSFILTVLISTIGGNIQAQQTWLYKNESLIYENAFSQAEDVSDWIMEGPAGVDFRDGWMHMRSPQEEGHHVFWCPEDFPTDFIAEWELQNMETDAGLCIIFFSAIGGNGEDIFHSSIKKRDGVFQKYTKSDINNYHISYYAHTPNAPNRPYAHLRKNAGFHIVMEGDAPIPAASKNIHKVRLLKYGPHIQMFVDDRKLIDWIDDGKLGQVLEGGKIGFRQMKWTHFRYRNFKVWSVLQENAAWPIHTIDNSSQGADGVKLADINSDGAQDIVTGWEEGGLTKLYLNPGKDLVKEKWPSVIVGKTPHVEDAVFADMNNDGQLDIVSCTENQSERIYIHWAPKKEFLNQKNWRQEILPASDQRMMWMYAEPLQIDNRYGSDLIAAGKGENGAIGWFSAPSKATQLNKWEWHGLSPVGWIMSIILKDMDNDGDLDITISDRRGELQACRWLENPGSQRNLNKPWSNHLIGAAGLEVMFMSMSDLDGDGSEEVVVTEYTEETIRIFKNLDRVGKQWRESIIPLPEFTGRAKSVEVGDLNGDGVPDLVISTNTLGKKLHGLIWLDGNEIYTATTDDFQPISGAHHAKYDKVELIDLDKDGDLDVLICEENFGPSSEGLGVVWYENKLGEE